MLNKKNTIGGFGGERLFLRLMLFSLLIVGCVKEPISRYDAEEGTNVQIYIDVPEQKVVDTKASQPDSYINSREVFVFVFDGEGEDAKLKDLNVANLFTDASSTASGFVVNLKESNERRVLYISANSEAVIKKCKDAGKLILDASFSDIKNCLFSASLPKTGGVIIEQPTLQPMLSDKIILNSIASNTVIGDAANGIELTRVTSKITVHNQSGAGGVNTFEILGANLCGVPENYYIFPGKSNLPTTANYGEGGNVDNPLVGVDGNGDTEPLYCYESPAAKNSFVVVKVSYRGIEGYHRINLQKNNAQLDLKRNYHYKVNIKNILTSGYTTATEAIANSASNRDIDYDISITDGDSYDIVSNGEQYLSTSNSELFIYNTTAMSNVLVATLTYTANANWADGSITLPGKMTFASGDKTLRKPVGTAAATRELRVNIEDSFSEGYVVVRIGDLSLRIKVKKEKNILAFNEPLEFDGYVMGLKGVIGKNESANNVEFPDDSWVRLSDKAGKMPLEDPERLVNNGGKIYLHFASNFGFEDEVKPRAGEMFFAKADDSGRKKVIFNQEKFDVYTQPVEIVPFTYVGTFHRWNETGERIIRIGSKSEFVDNSGTFKALVIYGDFIRLSTAQSADPGVGTHPYGEGDNPTWKTASDIETKDSNKASDPGATGWSTGITGTVIPVVPSVNGAESSIYFRVSLTSQLPSPDSPPRYGLIALVHNKGVHFIYVRQGENPDYLMRKTDPITKDPSGYDNWTNPDRPLAAMFSPYNLVDPNKGTGWIDVNSNSVSEVRFPSQGGYYFLPTSNKASHPTFKGHLDGANYDRGGIPVAVPFAPNVDVCPPGYRMPYDGAEGRVYQYATDAIPPLIGTATDTPTASVSEIRQSLWLYPRDYGKSQAANQIPNFRRGYYADGFFDRRKMREFGDATTTPYSAVVGLIDGAETDEVYNVAFAGALFFNPHDHTSIFFPESGYYNNEQGWPFGAVPSNKLGLAGGAGVYPTKTIATVTGTQLWAAQTGNISNPLGTRVSDNYVFDIGLATPIRCVKANK